LRVMQTLKVDEDQAYKHLRKKAMNCGFSIAAISKTIMDANAG
jgi:AmiR/NasT family two-component response regulator